MQYYVNLRAVRSNARLIVEQEQAILAGVALGVNSISSGEYLYEMRKEAQQPSLDEQAGRIKNVLVVDGEGNVQDSLNRENAPTTNPDGSKRFVRVKDVSLPPLNIATPLCNTASANFIEKAFVFSLINWRWSLQKWSEAEKFQISNFKKNIKYLK